MGTLFGHCSGTPPENWSGCSPENWMGAFHFARISFHPLFSKSPPIFRCTSRQKLSKTNGLSPKKSGREIHLPTIASWWFQPLWKIVVKLGIFSPGRDENKKYLKPPTRLIFRGDVCFQWSTVRVLARVVFLKKCSHSTEFVSAASPHPRRP